MKINIGKQGKAVLISFHSKSKAFDSPSDRNKFFFGLHGRRQTIRKQGREYIYRRKGLLDRVPHLKVDDSVFIVGRKDIGKVLNFFERWQDKVMIKTFTVLLNELRLKRLSGNKRRIKIE